MTDEDVRDLFGALGPIRTRRMFGGVGVYLDDAMFALIADGRIFMKTDDALARRYAETGSEPFVHGGRRKPVAMSFWSLPDAAIDDPEAATAWARASLVPAQAAAHARQRG